MTDHLKGHASLAEMVSTHIASFREALKCIRGDVLEVVNGDYWQHELNALSDIEKACAIEAARATAEQSEPMAWMRTYRQFSEHPIEPDPGYLVTSFHQNADYAAKHPAENVPLYAAPQPSHNRDSVIEQCAKVCEKIADLLKTGSVATAVETAEGCASEIRALKSQQDAAIESQRSGDGS